MKSLYTSIAFAASLTLMAWSDPAQAQTPQWVCRPGKGCSFEVTPPPVQWTPPPVQGGGQVSVPGVGGTIQTDPNAQYRLEMERRARWDAYFSWQAKVKLDAKISFNIRGYVDLAKWKLRGQPDPYAAKPPPVIPVGGDGGSFYILGDILAACVGAYAGPGSPYYIGYCPAVRFRIAKYLRIALEPAIVQTYHGTDPRAFGMAGLRPGLEFTFLGGGKRERGGSRGYAIAGADSWFPFASDGRAPTAFLGAHVGLGLMVSLERTFSMGVEARGLLRGGVGDDGVDIAKEMSVLRGGYEIRMIMISLTR